MQFCVIKMKVAEDSYEYIITNLPYSFDLEYLKTCYHWRWQIEVAFRYLKHANGLLYFHSKKPEYLKQEIYANLILYNFGVFLANEAIQENQKKKHRITNKYQYEVDFSSALKISRKYFIRGRSSENRIIKLIAKHLRFSALSMDSKNGMISLAVMTVHWLMRSLIKSHMTVTGSISQALMLSMISL